MAVRDTIERLAAEWASPKKAIHRGRATSLPLACSVEPGPSMGDPGVLAPADLDEFWRAFRAARLFVDTSHGQWGLVLHNPEEARALTKKFRAQRTRDHAEGDLVLGEFLGDAELLFVRCDPKAADYGRVVVALPLDPRSDWYEVAESLGAFLDQYERAQGAKFWEEV